MKNSFFYLLILAGFSPVICFGLEPSLPGRYHPIGLLESPLSQAAARGYHPIKASDRVFLPGLRPQSAELLQQTLSERYPRTVGGSPVAIANKAVPKIFSDSRSFAQTRGIYAERWFVHRNPHIGLVGTRNASQLDAYSRIIGRKAPVGYQIKTLSGGPADYARSMVADHRARWFVIPDDHVEAVRENWRQTGEAHLKAGRTVEAKQAFRQRKRVLPLGTTMKGLEDQMREGGRVLLREQTARYVSVGAAAALALGPALADYIEDGELSAAGARQAARTVSLFGSAAGTNYALGKYRNGALRGTLRGNVITGAVMVMVDTSFAIYDYGGAAAFSRPEFYEQLGGGISGTAMGLAVGIPVGAQVTAYTAYTGPWAPVIGGAAGIVTGGVAGLVGHIGGRSGTRFVMQLAMPDLYARQSLQSVREARETISRQITAAEAPPEYN